MSDFIHGYVFAKVRDGVGASYNQKYIAFIRPSFYFVFLYLGVLYIVRNIINFFSEDVKMSDLTCLHVEITKCYFEAAQKKMNDISNDQMPSTRCEDV